MLQVNQVSKSFGEVRAVDGVSFTIEKGEIVGLLGPNGAGKTTTMRMMTGFYSPTQGDVMIDGVSMQDRRYELQNKIGYLPESAASYTDMLVCDYLNFIAEARGLTGVAIANGIDLAVTATSLQSYYYRPISELSKGYRQRVGLAASLLHDPEILILDEPTAGLDPNQIIEIQNLIRKLNQTKTIILSTHILSEVEATCQRVLIINNGKLILDNPLSQLQGLRQGKSKFRASLKGRQEQALSALQRIFQQNDESVQQLGLSENETTFNIVAGADGGERIFQAAVNNHWVLTEMAREKHTLEDIFKNLTN